MRCSTKPLSCSHNKSSLQVVSQRTYAWKLPKRFRTKGFVINFFHHKQRKFRRRGFVVNFFRTLQKRFYIESFVANFFNISRKIPYFLSSHYSLHSLDSLPFCCPLYSFDFLHHPYSFTLSTRCTPFTFFTLCISCTLFIPLHCLRIL